MDAQMPLLTGGERRRRGRRPGRPRRRLPWVLDADTRARGLAGVAEARRALEDAHPPAPEGYRWAS